MLAPSHVFVKRLYDTEEEEEEMILITTRRGEKKHLVSFDLVNSSARLAFLLKSISTPTFNHFTS